MIRKAADIQDSYIDELKSLEDASDVCDYLIELGLRHPDRQEIRDDEHRIPGCKSVIWCDVSAQENKVLVKTDSDSLLIKGVLKIVEDICDEQDPKEISKQPLRFLEYIDTSVIYEEIRRNGLYRCYEKMIGFDQEGEEK